MGRAEFRNLDLTTVKTVEFESSVSDIEELKRTRVTQDEFREKTRKNLSKVMDTVQREYSQKSDLGSLAEKLDTEANSLRESDANIEKQLSLAEQQLSSQIQDVSLRLSQKPWMPKIKEIHSEMSTRAKEADFVSLKT